MFDLNKIIHVHRVIADTPLKLRQLSQTHELHYKQLYVSIDKDLWLKKHDPN